MLVYHHWHAGQNNEIKIEDRLFENMAQFRYFEMRVADPNIIQEEIKRRLNSGNV
jgi:hypothetical protein